jgi:polysaccharide biosynthesis transport protein
MNAAAESASQMTLRDYLAAAARRRGVILWTAAISIAATLSLALLLPASYRSTATILIEQQELPADLVRSTVTSYADQRVQVISQRVMTTQTLLGIIDRYALYPKQRKKDSREALISRMREDIALNMISADVIDPRSGMPREATIAFSLSYTSRSPAQAARVANELTTLYLNENLTSRTRLAEDATSFLTGEAERLSKRIAELESALAEFKEAHQEQLPELSAMNLQLLDRTEQELRGVETRLASLDQQRVYLEAQLAQIKPNDLLLGDSGQRIVTPADRLKVVKSQLASVRAIYGPEHPDVQRLEREMAGLSTEANASASANSLAVKLEQARGELAQIREKYAPEHPDVLRLQREISALETELASAPRTVAAAAAVVADNPGYIQVKAQLEATTSDRDSLAAQVPRLKAQLAEYQRNITLAPQIEKQYRELARDYENAQAKYQEIRSKQMEATVAQNLESDRKSERFNLIEPPLPPEEPVSPNRKLILVLGVLFSLGLAFGAAAFREALDATVRGRKDVSLILNAPPLVLVPRIGTPDEARTSRRRLQFAAGTAVTAAMLSVFAVHFLYRPLDVLWLLVMRRFGL